MVLVQKQPFFSPFCQAIQARKMSFTIFQNGKTPFQPIKTRSSKSQNIHIFPKGLTYGFRPKMAILSNFFFLGNIAQENVLYDILQRKNSFLGYKTKNSKSRIIDIFPKGLTNGFGPKMAIFPNFFFRQNRPGKCFFTIFYNEKTLFYAIIATSSKSQKG